MKAIGYVRCSTTDQAVEGLSLEAQRSRIAAWCEATGSELVDVIEDAGVSGTRSLADRPGGSRIAYLAASRNPGVDTIVVARLDRLGRDAGETINYLKKFAKGSVGLVSVVDRLDLSTPQGKAMAGMSAVFAELERELIAERTADALEQLRASRKVYGPVPFGYRREADVLVEEPAEQKTIARMNRLRAKGKSYACVAETLNRSKVPAKRGGRWYAMSVRSVLLTAPKLCGESREAAA